MHERRGGEHQTFSLWSLLNYLLPIFAWPAKLLCSSNHASVCIVVSDELWNLYLWDSNIGLFVTKVFRSTMGAPINEAMLTAKWHSYRSVNLERNFWNYQLFQKMNKRREKTILRTLMTIFFLCFFLFWKN